MYYGEKKILNNDANNQKGLYLLCKIIKSTLKFKLWTNQKCLLHTV